MAAMADFDIAVAAEARSLVDRYRRRCLWFLQEDYYPQTEADLVRVLGYIECYGDLDAFRRAAALRQCLSRPTSAPSAGS
jgi:hypothetical protein